MGEMKCELRQWKRIGRQWGMKIMVNEHKTDIDSEEEEQKDQARVKHHAVPGPLAKKHP